jgi:hypothetical protein
MGKERRALKRKEESRQAKREFFIFISFDIFVLLKKKKNKKPEKNGKSLREDEDWIEKVLFVYLPMIYLKG